MNVRLLISLFFFNSALNFAQTEIQPEIGALVYTSRKGYYDSGKTHDLGNGRMVLSNNSYSGIKLKFGARFLFNDKSFSLNTQYQFLESRDRGFKGNLIALKSNLIGVGADLRFFEKKRVRLFFQLSLLTELSTNYKDKWLSVEYYTPRDFLPYETEGNYNYTNVYKGTPFVGNLAVGCNVKLLSGLSLNFTAAYGIRLMRSQYAVVYHDANELSPNQINVKNIDGQYLVPFHMFDFQAGLSYAFSLKKKPKTEMP